MSDEALFPGYEPVPALEVPKLSPDRRRTLRQATAIRNGVHPLALVFGATVRMHPDADLNANASDGPRRPFTCGTCRFRFTVHMGGTYPNCGYGDGSRATHGAATDVRAWWPACADYSAGEGEFSDAARYIPARRVEKAGETL